MRRRELRRQQRMRRRDTTEGPRPAHRGLLKQCPRLQRRLNALHRVRAKPAAGTAGGPKSQSDPKPPDLCRVRNLSKLNCAADRALSRLAAQLHHGQLRQSLPAHGAGIAASVQHLDQGHRECGWRRPEHRSAVLRRPQGDVAEWQHVLPLAKPLRQPRHFLVLHPWAGGHQLRRGNRERI